MTAYLRGNGQLRIPDYNASVACALALTPIVWLHYFALLVVVVALARPRLAVVWFVPLLMILTPGSGLASPVHTAWTLAVAALTIGLALHASGREEQVTVSRPEPRTA